ncbi:MAG: beta-1,6-N-acetylglucosaminyltransferase [Syntrophorhabdales bacterium]|jgi:hypothetical protein
MENIAYIITAYKDPIHLRRLINALDFHADFYIHIDRKADIRTFRKEFSSIQRKIYYISKYHISWGGYSQVLSQRELLHAVISSGEQYKRVVCLSGQDYPILSNIRIHKRFDENSRKEFIGGINISHDAPKQLHKIVHYNLFDLFSGKYPILNRIMRKLLNMMNNTLNLTKQNQSWLNGKVADIFFGSDYWAITYDCAKYVYNSLCSEKKFLKYMKTAYAPSELCINTIVFNSEFGKNAIRIAKDYDKGLEGYEAFEKISLIHYVVYKEKVYSLDDSDFSNILNSHKMFFRKAETGISDKLMDRIDELRETETLQL